MTRFRPPVKTITLFIFAAVLLAGCAVAPEEKPVVTVEDWTMNVAQFRNLLQGAYGVESLDSLNEDQIQNLLDRVLRHRLFVEEGYAQSLDTMQYSRDLYDRSHRNLANKALFTDAVLDEVMPESVLREFYEHDTHRIRAQHILIRSQGRSEDEARALIDSVYQLASQPDADFAKLAEQVSEDATTPDGDIGWFEWGRMVDPFQEAAFELEVGEISAPVRTEYGWHLIHLTDREAKHPRPSFKAARNDIRERLSARYAAEIRDKTIGYLEQLRTEYDVQVDSQAVDSVINIFTSTKPIAGNPLGVFSPAQRNIVLATMNVDPKEYTLEDLISFMEENVPADKRQLQHATMVPMLYQVITQKVLLPIEVRKRGIDKDDQVDQAARAAMEEYIGNYARNQYGERAGQPAPEQVREYYLQHEDRYHADTLYSGYEVLVSDEGLMNSIIQSIRRGAPIQQLARQYSIRAKAKSTGGFQENVAPEQYYGPAANYFDGVKAGDLIGPIPLSGASAVFKVTEVKANTETELSQVYQQVSLDLRDEMIRDLLDTWVDTLKTRYDYKIHEKNLPLVLGE
jgi:parvulin-like peptidyl-prolyl isomerase